MGYVYIVCSSVVEQFGQQSVAIIYISKVYASPEEAIESEAQRPRVTGTRALILPALEPLP